MESIKRYGIVATIAGGLVGMGFLVPAAAQTETGAAGQVEAAFTSLRGDLTGVYIPAMIGLVILGVGVALGLKWLRKATSKA